MSVFGMKPKLDLDKINEYDIDKHSINKNRIVQILLTPFDDRKIEYLAELKTYLLKISKLPNKFFIEHINEPSYMKIIDNSLYTCEYKKIRNKNSIIYDINKEAYYFYIILNGQVKLSKLKKLQKEMNGYNYYNILLNYKKQKEYYLLKKTIDDNYYNFPVDYNDIENIENILIKLNIMKMEYENNSNYPPEYLENLIKNFGSSLSYFGLESYKDVIKRKNEEIIVINNKLINEKKLGKCQKLIEYSIYEARNHSYRNQKILKEKLKYISPDVCRKYYFFLSESYEKVTYYEFGEEKEITTNDYFGDFENNKYIQRSYSLSNNLELLCMRNDMYKDFLRYERGKIIDSQVSFLLNNFFFEKINKEHFTRYYFPLFETVSYHMNQIIVKENDKVDYIYFIRNGTVKLISNRSILETHIIIELIENIFNKNSEDKNDNIENHDNNINNNKKYILKNNLDFLGKEINLKHYRHLITYQSNQCIGFECFYYGLNYLYTAIAVSKEVKIYRIKIKHLIEVLNDKGENCLRDFGKKSENKMNLLFERFTLINNELMKFYDRKIINKNRNEESKYISVSPKLIKNIKEDNNSIEEKRNDKLLLINNLFRDNVKKKSNCKNQSKLTNYFDLKNKILSPKSNKKLDFFAKFYEKKEGYKSEYRYKLKNKISNYKSLENQIYRKLIEYDNYSCSNDTFNCTFKRNKTLDSLSTINKNNNNNKFLFSPYYNKIMNNKLKKKILSPQNVKIKSKIFDNKPYKDYLYNNSIKKKFKYDFRKTLNANKKLFIYSIFDINSSKNISNSINSLENQFNITNEINKNINK